MIVGDGAFQMTGMELSTIARHGLNPIVVVLNNHGYTTERFLLDGPFNDIHDWAVPQDPRGPRQRAWAWRSGPRASSTPRSKAAAGEHRRASAC